MIFRAPLFSLFLFLSAWHSVLDLQERSPDRKRTDTAIWSAEQFPSYCPPSRCVFFSSQLLSDRENHGKWIDYRRDCLLRYD